MLDAFCTFWRRRHVWTGCGASFPRIPGSRSVCPHSMCSDSVCPHSMCSEALNFEAGLWGFRSCTDLCPEGSSSTRPSPHRRFTQSSFVVSLCGWLLLGVCVLPSAITHVPEIFLSLLHCSDTEAQCEVMQEIVDQVLEVRNPSP